jgi:hypothetical protein
MSLNEFIKKAKLKIDLSKYKLNNNQIDEVYNLYNYVIKIFLDNFSDELEKNKDISRTRIDTKLIEDITRIVLMNKSFIINDITMEYIINKKNSFTIFQFLNNFHYLSQASNDNEHLYYNLANFINYVMNKGYEDKEYLDKVLSNPSLSKITIDYASNVSSFKDVSDTEGILNMYNYIVGIIWYNELIKEYPDIVIDMCVYLLNHYDEIKAQIEDDSTMSDTSYSDNIDTIIDMYKNKKMMKLK